MKFIQTHSVGSDETAPYDVVDFVSETAYEFVFEVLKYKNEWGYIRVRGLFPVKYRFGKLLDEIPDSWKYFRINKVFSSGGWSRMDYYIE